MSTGIVKVLEDEQSCGCALVSGLTVRERRQLPAHLNWMSDFIRPSSWQTKKKHLTTFLLFSPTIWSSLFGLPNFIFHHPVVFQQTLAFFFSPPPSGGFLRLCRSNNILFSFASTCMLQGNQSSAITSLHCKTTCQVVLCGRKWAV